MAACNLDLFILRVTGNADDFHAVHERRRNIQRIGRRDEHDIRQVVVDFEIVIVEAMILLRIENFEQRGRRIAPEVHSHLVDFVEQEERVRALGLAHRLDDLAGHRTDIGAPMAANFGFVAHAAKRHADEFTARGLGD